MLYVLSSSEDVDFTTGSGVLVSHNGIIRCLYAVLYGVAVQLYIRCPV